MLTYDQAGLSHETLTNLPLRLETVLLAPVVNPENETRWKVNFSEVQ